MGEKYRIRIKSQEVLSRYIKKIQIFEFIKIFRYAIKISNIGKAIFVHKSFLLNLLLLNKKYISRKSVYKIRK